MATSATRRPRGVQRARRGRGGGRCGRATSALRPTTRSTTVPDAGVGLLRRRVGSPRGRPLASPESLDVDESADTFSLAAPAGRARAAVGAVEPAALEHDADRREHLAEPAGALGAVGQRRVGEATARPRTGVRRRCRRTGRSARVPPQSGTPRQRVPVYRAGSICAAEHRHTRFGKNAPPSPDGRAVRRAARRPARPRRAPPPARRRVRPAAASGRRSPRPGPAARRAGPPPAPGAAPGRRGGRHPARAASPRAPAGRTVRRPARPGPRTGPSPAVPSRSATTGSSTSCPAARSASTPAGDHGSTPTGRCAHTGPSIRPASPSAASVSSAACRARTSGSRARRAARIRRRHAAFSAAHVDRVAVREPSRPHATAADRLRTPRGHSEPACAPWDRECPCTAGKRDEGWRWSRGRPARQGGSRGGRRRCRCGRSTSSSP